LSPGEAQPLFRGHAQLPAHWHPPTCLRGIELQAALCQ
jgi:hypothetical protein